MDPHDLKVCNGSRASPSAIDGCPSTSAMPGLRPKSCGGAKCRDGPQRDMRPLLSSAVLRPKVHPTYKPIDKRLRADGRIPQAVSPCAGGPLRTRAQLEAEIAASVNVLRRQAPSRPRLTAAEAYTRRQSHAARSLAAWQLSGGCRPYLFRRVRAMEVPAQQLKPPRRERTTKSQAQAAEWHWGRPRISHWVATRSLMSGYLTQAHQSTNLSTASDNYELSRLMAQSGMMPSWAYRRFGSWGP